MPSINFGQKDTFSFACKTNKCEPNTASLSLSNEFGLKSHKPALLTTSMKFNRFDFANELEDWTAEQWVKVLFLEETLTQQLVMRTRHVGGRQGKELMENTQNSQQTTHPA